MLHDEGMELPISPRALGELYQSEFSKHELITGGSFREGEYPIPENLASRAILDKYILKILYLTKLANYRAMQIINIHQAKTNLSKLIEQVLAGNEVIIAKAGKPVAKLVGYSDQQKPRKPGLWKGKVFISENFNDEDEEINKLFYGEK